ncbi:MAG: 4-alpha-glucanotransferase, partial [Bacteroidales bacterium]|nr:4-alpha-glucanotransferase [Bacteroidales bacterium]
MYPMTWGEGDVWKLSLDSVPREYFYAVTEGGIITRTEWEKHLLSKRSGKKEIVDKWIDCPIPGCPFPRKHSAAIFDVPGYRGSGTAIPVFSLRGKDGFGVGEFNDLPTFVDWMKKTGQTVLQLLPVNDTSRLGEWGDSYPYSPVSAFALHPLFIHLQDVGVKPDKRFRELQKKLNSEPFVDYPEVMRLKSGYLLEAFAQNGEKDMAKETFKKFEKDNAEWLGPYARLMAERSGNDASFFRWVQYHLDRQLKKAVAYAHKKGVYLKGDLPIGVGRDSVDAHSFPKLFNLDSSAGAPPDFFSAEGQNWGFPTYNWEEMAKDGYAWWKRRLRKMAEYFDAFRIDHILGFFRIWEIPLGQKGGRLGHFNPAIPYVRGEIEAAGLPIEGLFVEDPHHEGMYHPVISPDTSALADWQKERFSAIWNDFFFHRHNEFWKRNALTKLPHLLSATGMLAC